MLGRRRKRRANIETTLVQARACWGATSANRILWPKVGSSHTDVGLMIYIYQGGHYRALLFHVCFVIEKYLT